MKKIKCWGYNVKRERWPINPEQTQWMVASGQLFIWLDPKLEWQGKYVRDNEPQPEFNLIPWREDYAVLVKSDREFMVFMGRGAIHRAMNES